jgi:hypothetical protein
MEIIKSGTVASRPTKTTISGKLKFDNSYAYINDGHHDINLFAWLASFGLRDEQVTITVEKVGWIGNSIRRNTI